MPGKWRFGWRRRGGTQQENWVAFCYSRARPNVFVPAACAAHADKQAGWPRLVSTGSMTHGSSPAQALSRARGIQQTALRLMGTGATHLPILGALPLLFVLTLGPQRALERKFVVA